MLCWKMGHSILLEVKIKYFTFVFLIKVTDFLKSHLQEFRCESKWKLKAPVVLEFISYPLFKYSYAGVTLSSVCEVRWEITISANGLGGQKTELSVHDVHGDAAVGCINQLIMSLKEFWSTSQGKQVSSMAFCLGASWTSVKQIPGRSTSRNAAEVFRDFDLQHDHYLLHHLHTYLRIPYQVAHWMWIL